MILKGAALRRFDISLLETGRHPKTALTMFICRRNPMKYRVSQKNVNLFLNGISPLCVKQSFQTFLWLFQNYTPLLWERFNI